MGMVVPPLYTFSAEYSGDSPAYDDLDDYLRVELAQGGEEGLNPKFGKQAQFVPDFNRFDYTYTLTGSVPGATSREEAETKVRALLGRIEKGLKQREARLKDPVVRVWKHEHHETETAAGEK